MKSIKSNTKLHKTQSVAATDLEQGLHINQIRNPLMVFALCMEMQSQSPENTDVMGVIPPRFFLGLVVIARAKHPIPSRTRQLSAVAPMVLHLKVWESRSPPNLIRNAILSKTISMTPRSRVMKAHKTRSSSKAVAQK